MTLAKGFHTVGTPSQIREAQHLHRAGIPAHALAEQFGYSRRTMERWLHKPPPPDHVLGTWAEHAACRGANPELFYPEVGETTQEAKQICRECPVRLDCLRHALDHDERHGVWGALSPEERRRLRAR